jgi:hypothetical protein
MSTTRFLRTAFKAILICTVVGLSGFFTLSFRVQRKADDVWKLLGITVPQAHQDINSSFIYGHFDYLGAKLAKDVAMNNRVAVVNQLVDYAKKYITGSEFKTAYNNYRAGIKPKEPVRLPITAESIRADEKTRLEAALKQAEEGLNSTNPKIKNGAPTRIDNVKKELAALDDPSNATVKRRLADADRSYNYAMKIYTDAVNKFETEYPEDPKPLLKKRLQQMLDITESVDYTAELKEGGKYKLFVNPEYERKPKEWKLAYRAGKQVTDAVRSAAQKWLKELN